jgi:hypothetical protein
MIQHTPAVASIQPTEFNRIINQPSPTDGIIDCARTAAALRAKAAGMEATDGVA